MLFSTAGMEESAFECVNPGFPANISNTQGGESLRFVPGQCHLLYFVVVRECVGESQHGNHKDQGLPPRFHALFPQWPLGNSNHDWKCRFRSFQ